jgi:hypothetical protein
MDRKLYSMGSRSEIVYGGSMSRLRPDTVFRMLARAGVTASLLVASICPAAESINYSLEIQPILARNCFACHGPDDHDRKAGLRVDTLAAATADRDASPAIVPGSAEKSQLWKRINHKDAAERMPPTDTGKTLSQQEKQLLRDWINQGAKYAGHWAFEKPVKTELPKVSNAGWPRSDLDRFVLKKLDEAGLKPSPTADRITLLRRLSLDLIGLPPTPGEVDAFLKDGSPDAYDRQIERLLKSQHYGERWGRIWLDAARYADTDGYEKDKPRTVWFYRDWVINAFNRDLPYDDFIIEQLAGDLLPTPTQDQIVATGFLRNSMLNEEGGIDPEQFRMEAMFDRMDAVGKSILGMTIQCSQCHNHKYDPLTQKEYYQLFAYLNNVEEAVPVVYPADQLRQVNSLQRKIRRIEAGLKKKHPDWRKRIEKWGQEIRADDRRWQPLDIVNIGNHAQRYGRLADGSLLAAGYSPPRFTSTFAHTNELENITAIRVELMTNPNLPGYGPGRSYKGLFALSELRVNIATQADPKKKTKVAFAGAMSDFDQPEAELEARFDDGTKNRRVTGPASYAIDGDTKTAWSNDRGPGRRNSDTVAVFKLKQPIGSKQGNVLYLDLSQVHGGKSGNDFVAQNLGRFRISVLTGPSSGKTPVAPNIRELLARAAASRSGVEWNTLFSHWRTTVVEFADANRQVEALWKQWPEGTTAYAFQVREMARSTTILNRGDWLKPGGVVEPGVPAFLHKLPKEAAPNRLTLARWLASKNSPTTARAFVNRVWQAYFGKGLVTTPEDFGIQGEPPTHPGLLDWLSVEFMDSGWSIKHLHRLIVNSATYRQRSRVSEKLLAKDPYNRLLARGSRFRIDAELVRDVTLAVSGLLNPKMGGPSVMVPAPIFLFKAPASYGDFPWVNDTGPDKYRRAVYTYRRRSTPFPALTVFDAPPGDFSCVSRQRSNTPLQALTTLNEPLFMEAAQALALKTVRKGGKSHESRMRYAFRRCVSRRPDAVEFKALLNLLNNQNRRFAGDEKNAWILATTDPENRPDLPNGTTAGNLAAWTAVSRVLLNMDETITKE